MKKICLAGCIGLAIMSAPAFAYDYSYTETPETTNGFESIYAGANVGFLGGDGGEVCDGIDANCTSWKGYAGYRSSEHLAFEGGYHSLINNRSSVTQQHVDVSALSLSVLGITSIADIEALDFVPGHENLEVFGRLGLAAWDSKVDHATANDGTDFLLGGGAQMKMTDNLGIRGEWEYFGGDVDSSNYSAGVTYSTF